MRRMSKRAPTWGNVLIYLLERLGGGKWKVLQSAYGKWSLVWVSSVEIYFGSHSGVSEEGDTH